MARTASPVFLTLHGQSWGVAFKAARKMDKSHAFAWPNRANYVEIRDALTASSEGHCAFCDGFLGVTSPATVEHFLPKSRFPRVAFHWLNLYPCCYSCQLNKKERYEHGLLRPDADGYRFSEYFIVDFASGRIGSLPSLGARDMERAKRTIRLYGLDSPERNAARKEALDEAERVGAVSSSARNFRFLFD